MEASFSWIHSCCVCGCCALAADGSYDYGQVLGLSMMFYEAQRSGKLPPTNRIKWRDDAGLDHKAPDGRDVTGGWYDAGDNVKFNLPMAWSAGVLAWSLVEFEQVGWGLGFGLNPEGSGSDGTVLG